MRTSIVAISIVLLGWLGWPGSAAAQMVCGKRAMLAEALEKSHAEAPVSMGVAGTGAVVEVFASTKGSWTILLTRPDGLSCLLAAGESWENLPVAVHNTRT